MGAKVSTEGASRSREEGIGRTAWGRLGAKQEGHRRQDLIGQGYHGRGLPRQLVYDVATESYALRYWFQLESLGGLRLWREVEAPPPVEESDVIAQFEVNFGFAHALQ